MKKIIKKILIIIFIILEFIIIDTFQSIYWDNAPILSIRRQKDYYKEAKGLLVTTFYYCNGIKTTKSNFLPATYIYTFKGCEGPDVEEYIISNLTLIANNPEYTYDNRMKNSSYIALRELKDGVPTIENLYYNNRLTEKEAYISAYLIEDLSYCNMKDEFNEDWQNAEEFYNLWQKSKCRKEKYEK